MSLSRKAKTRAAHRKPGDPTSTGVLEGIDASLLDIVDHVLNQGIVVTGDLVLGVADVDLVYLRASVVLCAADRILGPRPRSKTPEPPRLPALGRGIAARGRRR